MIELINKIEYDECMRLAGVVESAMRAVDEAGDAGEPYMNEDDYEELMVGANGLLFRAKILFEKAASAHFIDTATLVTQGN